MRQTLGSYNGAFRLFIIIILVMQLLIYPITITNAMATTKTYIPVTNNGFSSSLGTRNLLLTTDAQQNNEVQIIEGTVEVPDDLLDSIKQAIQNGIDLLPTSQYYAITDIQNYDSWKFISVVGLVNIEQPSKWNIIDNGVWFGLVLVEDQNNKPIKSAIEGTQEYTQILSTIPNYVLPLRVKSDLDPSSVNPSAYTGYAFPWESGTSMRYGVAGVHDNGFSTGWKAVDFVSDGASGHSPNRLLAAATGTISYRCSPRSGENTTAVRIGDLFYTHLITNSNLAIGRSFSQGEELGQMRTGSFNENCGYADQNSSSFHVHLGFPDNGTVTFEDWVLNISSGVWTKGAESRRTGDWIQANWGNGGSSCPGPSQSSPDAGYVSSSQTINFSWNAPSGCTYQGYTFRVKDTSNMESGGSTYVDEGQGGTSVTKTFGTELNNRDLYWGVQTANPQSHNWSVRRFRIEPNPTPAGSWNARFAEGDSCWWDTNCGQWTGSATPKCETTVQGAQLNVNYGSNAPCGGMSGDNWVGNYTSTINFSSGNYVFYLDHDDGAKLWINGTNRGDFGGSGNNFICNGSGGFSLNGNQSMRVMLREEGGDARVKLSWNTDTSICVPLSAPSGLTATSVSSSQINLSWADNSPDETNFRIERSPNGNDGWSQIATVNANTTVYSDTGLSSNTRYYYRVRAYRSNGDRYSDFSNVANAITVSPLQAPSNLSVTTLSASELRLAWTDNSNDESSFAIDRSPNGSSGWSEVATVAANTTAYTNSGLSPNTAYYYRVRAYRSSDNSYSGYSNTASSTTSGGAPAAPGNFRFTGKTGTTLTMSWDDVTNETGYRIFQWNGSEFYLAHTLSANSTSFTDTGLICGGNEYFYELAAYNDIGESSHVGWISDTTDQCNAQCPVNINYWKGEYWSNSDLSGGLALCRDDVSLNFDWVETSPDVTLPGDQFSARWTRSLNFTPGTYRFHMSHDDGGRVFIDDVLEFDGWDTCCSWEEEEISITNGNHNIRVEMNELFYGAHLMLWWEPVNINGWRAEYYNNIDLSGPPAIVMDVPEINFNWGAGSPNALVLPDNFSARWTRSVDLQAGNYVFTLTHDNGAKLYVDGNLLYDHWCNGCVGNTQVTATLTAGMHEIQYEMVENSGGASASLSWALQVQQDTYEPDNSSAQAKPISTTAQTHSISPVGDEDWVTFTLSQPSDLLLETSGSGTYDTVLYLYNGSSQQIDLDDDSGTGAYSLIDRACGVDELAAGTYYARVIDYNNDGVIPTYQLQLTTRACAGAFAKLTPANGATDQSTSVTLDWANSANASSYEYCYDTTNDNACSNWISTQTTSQATVSGLANATTYYWQVRANTGAGPTYANGSQTAFWSFTTQAPPTPPGPFHKLSPVNNASSQATSLTLDWEDSSGATRYEYCYDTTNDNACSNWTSTGTTSQVAVNQLTNSTTYYWQVRAVNAVNATYANDTPAYWSFTTQPPPPGEFHKLTPANGSSLSTTSPTLDWGDSSGTTRYEYCYDTTNDDACTTWTSTGTTSQVGLTGLTSSSTYYWQVRAVSAVNTTYANDTPRYWSFTTPGTGVTLAIDPATANASIGADFSVTVQVRAGTRQVDGASAYINFNPTYLTVASITPGTTFSNVLENSYDNATGQINFSAGSLSNFPTGTFTLMTVTLHPVAQVTQTPLTFNTVNPRKSDATFGGASVLSSAQGGTVDITQSSTISGSVALQGRPAKPDASWGVPLTVDLTLVGQTTPRYHFTPASDNRGAFTLTNIQPGDYRVAVKNSHTLQVVQNLTVRNGANTAEFGPLPEGDANNDNYVTLLDFSVLASTYGKAEGGQGFDGRADFNEDNYITLLDFSLLATNFGRSGSVVSSGVTATNDTQSPEKYASLVIEPDSVRVLPGNTFKVSVMVDSGSYEVDSAQANINFDPALIQVVSMTGNTTAFPMTLDNKYDNTLGTLDYAAGALSNFPSGKIQLVEIVFRALSSEATTALTFNNIGLRKSDVASKGSSVLASTESATVLIGSKRFYFMPLVEQNK